MDLCCVFLFLYLLCISNDLFFNKPCGSSWHLEDVLLRQRPEMKKRSTRAHAHAESLVDEVRLEELRIGRIGLYSREFLFAALLHDHLWPKTKRPYASSTGSLGASEGCSKARVFLQDPAVLMLEHGTFGLKKTPPKPCKTRAKKTKKTPKNMKQNRCSWIFPTLQELLPFFDATLSSPRARACAWRRSLKGYQERFLWRVALLKKR